MNCQKCVKNTGSCHVKCLKDYGKLVLGVTYLLCIKCNFEYQSALKADRDRQDLPIMER